MASRATSVDDPTESDDPVNLITTDFIKCTFCNAFVPYHLLHHHCQLHIPPKYSLRLQNSTNRQSEYPKINLQGILSSQCEGESIKEISVKSFFPEELPAKESRKPNLAPQLLGHQWQPTGNGQPNRTNMKCEYKQEPDKLDLASRLTECDELPEKHQNLQIRKKIKMRLSAVSMEDKAINFCRNENQKGQYADGVTKATKTKELQNQQNTDAHQYLLTPPPELPKTSPTHKNQNQPIKVLIKAANKPAVLTKSQLTTASEADPGIFKVQRHPNQQTIKHTNNSSQATQEHTGGRSRLQCSQCKGFYCKQCGSAIPPMYRPIAAGVSNPLNQQITSYYKQQEGKTSRNRKCTNCE